MYIPVQAHWRVLVVRERFPPCKSTIEVEKNGRFVARGFFFGVSLWPYSRSRLVAEIRTCGRNLTGRICLSSVVRLQLIMINAR